MKLSRIRIEQFRRFRRPLEIAGLEPGINLFAGPNEAGKSTVVAAIRAAFFERHRSGTVEDLRPRGEPAAVPTVELDFEIGGRPYRLKKSFLGRKRCELDAHGRRYDGVEAEDHLAELLGFQYAGKGNSRAEHWGIPGLLWIQQGAGHELREPLAHATDRLRTVLDDALGEVAASGGDDILAAVEAERSRLLTPASGQPRGAYAEAAKLDAELAGRLRELQEAIARYRQDVDALEALRAEHARDEREAPWVAFRRQAGEAQAQLDAAARLQDDLAQARARLAQADERLEMLRRQLDGHAGEEAAAARRARERDDAAARAEAAGAVARDWERRHAEAARAHEDARARLRQARRQEERRAAARALEDLRARRERAGAALADAEAAQAALQEHRQRAAASAIAAGDVQRLRELLGQLGELAIRQEAAATRLRYELEEGRSIELAGRALAGSGEQLLVQDTEVVVPGVGRLRIAPGGADLARLRRDAEPLRDEQEALARRLGVAGLHEAEARLHAHQQASADARASAASLQALAPQGVDALRAELAGLDARLREAEADASASMDAGADVSMGDASAISAADAQAAEEAAAHSLRQAEQALAQARQEQVAAQAAAAAAERELAAARAVLDAPGRAERLAQANARLTDARAEHATLDGRIQDLLARLAAARPDVLRQDVERYTRSAEQHERSHAERRDRITRLEVALQAAGAQGLEERHAECRRDAEQAARRLRELRRRAQALEYLYGLLREQRRAVTARLQAPLRRHLDHYLQLLFPQASLEIDENLAPGALIRPSGDGGGAESGDFESLSFGAREQLGLVSRLAYADLLREAGRPTLVILDDALAHSDDRRLAQMKRVLFDAGSRHQVLLFTCHPDRWRDLGVAARSLPELAAAGN